MSIGANRLQWFRDRIGVLIYRRNIHECPCSHCKQMESEGIPITGHAEALAFHQIEQERNQIIYFDNINEL